MEELCPLLVKNPLALLILVLRIVDHRGLQMPLPFQVLFVVIKISKGIRNITWINHVNSWCVLLLGEYIYMCLLWTLELA